MRRRQLWARQSAVKRDAEATEQMIAQCGPIVVAEPVVTETGEMELIDGLRHELPKAGDPCPKCGKPLKARGRHLHINRCKGPQ